MTTILHCMPGPLKAISKRSRAWLSSAASVKPAHDVRRLVISCRRKEYDHYYGQKYGALEELTLASKGWKRSTSKGDHFVIFPTTDEHLDEPLVNIDELPIKSALINCLRTQGFMHFTGFQARAIATILEGRNATLAAETGCGKTLAYLLPIMDQLNGRSGVERPANSPLAVIVTPSRELALQIEAVARPLADVMGLRTKVVVGGHLKPLILNPEFEQFDVLIATPGALGKLSNTGIYRLNHVGYTVLDEADTLMDDSFMDRTGPIIAKVPQSQVLFVSATAPRIIPEQFQFIVDTMEHVTSSLLHKPLNNITQRFLRLLRSAKPSYLLQVAKRTQEPLLVFTNRNTTSKWLTMFLNENGVDCANVNGDMPYLIRVQQWARFSNMEVKVLSSTDVSSRGLDTTHVKHVLNYDFPLYAADYLHRIGRTGRFGSPNACKATNFVSGPEEVQLVQEIETAVRKNQALNNVDGNITKIIQKKILKGMRDRGEM